MRIACLQFAPTVGCVADNLKLADRVLEAANPGDLYDLDLLVLPEMAFSGYNFRSLQHIHPYLESPETGLSAEWARKTAIKYSCFVTVGYPETIDVSQRWPADPEYYNSSITFSDNGEEVANYHKTHLYYTDETWALEGDGFYSGRIHGLGKCAIGICKSSLSLTQLEIPKLTSGSPYKFLASAWHDYEFANHILDTRARLVILSNAWLTRENAAAFLRDPAAPDTDTLTYWIQRLSPLVLADRDYEIVVVIANRSGTEAEAVYAGTSTVLSIFQKKVKLYGILGRGTSELLMINTDAKPRSRIRLPPDLLEMAAARKVDPEADEEAIQIIPFELTSTMSTELSQRYADSKSVDGDHHYQDNTSLTSTAGSNEALANYGTANTTSYNLVSLHSAPTGLLPSRRELEAANRRRRESDASGQDSIRAVADESLSETVPPTPNTTVFEFIARESKTPKARRRKSRDSDADSVGAVANYGPVRAAVNQHDRGYHEFKRDVDERP